MINVLVADDHTMFREGLKQLLAGSAEVAIRGKPAMARSCSA